MNSLHGGLHRTSNAAAFEILRMAIFSVIWFLDPKKIQVYLAISTVMRTCLKLSTVYHCFKWMCYCLSFFSKGWPVMCYCLSLFPKMACYPV